MRNRTLGFSALAALVVASLFWLFGMLAVGRMGDGFGRGPGDWGPGAWGMGPGMMPGMMPWAGGTGLGWPSMLMMMGSTLLFWVAVILGLVLLVRWMAGQSGRGQSETVGALELARRRYARGDIDRQEFERLRNDLTSDRADSTQPIQDTVASAR